MAATLRQLRSWHRRLSTAHSKVCDVAEEAEAALGYDDAVIIMDPSVELHAALNVIEGLIRERVSRKDPSQ
ncbi:MAG: hypothetical protein KA105_02510 [Caulobacter sp.]|nr:hypothetical protein [Caulobacter sp.]